MSNITDADINRAARAVRARLERVLEFQVPFGDPDYMEVRKAEQTRERGRAWRSREVVATPATERMGL